MKKESGNKIRLGLFVSIGVLLFIAGIYFVGVQKQLFNKTFVITSVFSNVSGLQTGNNVRVSGINVGIVETIEIINDTSVRVWMRIDNKVRQFIRRDAKVAIGSDGLMGNKVMNIAAGSPNELIVEDYTELHSISPINMDDVLNKLKSTTDNAAQISSDLSAITNSIRNGRGTIGKLFMDSVFAENLDKTLSNVQQGSKGFKQNMDAAKNSFLLKGYFKKKEKEAKQQKQEEGRNNQKIK